MDFISNNFLNREDIKELQTYFDGYQHLGIAWKFLRFAMRTPGTAAYLEERDTPRVF
jgi:hypothetical protein